MLICQRVSHHDADGQTCVQFVFAQSTGQSRRNMALCRYKSKLHPRLTLTTNFTPQLCLSIVDTALPKVTKLFRQYNFAAKSVQLPQFAMISPKISTRGNCRHRFAYSRLVQHSIESSRTKGMVATIAIVL